MCVLFQNCLQSSCRIGYTGEAMRLWDRKIFLTTTHNDDIEFLSCELRVNFVRTEFSSNCRCVANSFLSHLPVEPVYHSLTDIDAHNLLAMLCQRNRQNPYVSRRLLVPASSVSRRHWLTIATSKIHKDRLLWV